MNNSNLLKESIKKSYLRLPFSKIYSKYRTTDGDAKSMCAELMADTLTNESRMIMEDDIEEFLDTIELDSLWHLAIASKNMHIKDEARKKVIAMLIDDANKEVLDEKIEVDLELDRKEEQEKVLKLHK